MVRVEGKFSFACSYLPGFEGCTKICPVPNFGKYLEKIGYCVEEIASTMDDHAENAGLASDKDESNYDALIVFDIKKNSKDITNVVFAYKISSCKEEVKFAINASGPLARQIMSEAEKITRKFEVFSKAVKESGIEEILIEDD